MKKLSSIEFMQITAELQEIWQTDELEANTVLGIMREAGVLIYRGNDGNFYLPETAEELQEYYEQKAIGLLVKVNEATDKLRRQCMRTWKHTEQF